MKRIKKKWIIITGAFLLSVSIMVVLFSVLELLHYYQERQYLQRITELYANRVEISTNTMMKKTDTLAELVRINPQDVSWFSYIAKSMKDESSIIGFQLAREGMPFMTYPADDQPWMQGDASFKKAFSRGRELALHNGAATLYGPFLMNDGTYGVIGIQPISIYNGKDGFTHWGSSSIILQAPYAFREVDADHLQKMGYAYRVISLAAGQDEPQVIAQSQSSVGANPVRVKVNVPNGQWIMEAAPPYGWLDMHVFLSEILAGVILSFLFALAVYFFLTLQEQRERMRVLAITDPLTMLHNRNILMNELTERCGDRQNHFLLCYMDLDGFKQVNDTFGHETGDVLIKEAAQRIKICLKAEDDLFRIGGDEFVALLEEESLEGWRGRVQKIERELLQVFDIEGAGPIQISISIGSALYPQTSRDPEELLRRAERNMQDVKIRFS